MNFLSRIYGTLCGPLEISGGPLVVQAYSLLTPHMKICLCSKMKHLHQTIEDYLSSLTLWRLGGFGDFRKKNSSFRLPYQRPSSSANCARELFNGSNGSASLVDCTQKNCFAWGCRFFVSDIISGGLLGHLGPLCLAVAANR